MTSVEPRRRAGDLAVVFDDRPPVRRHRPVRPGVADPRPRPAPRRPGGDRRRVLVARARRRARRPPRRWPSPAGRPATASCTARTTGCPGSSSTATTTTFVVKAYSAAWLAARRRGRRCPRRAASSRPRSCCACGRRSRSPAPAFDGVGRCSATLPDEPVPFREDGPDVRGRRRARPEDRALPRPARQPGAGSARMADRAPGARRVRLHRRLLGARRRRRGDGGDERRPERARRWRRRGATWPSTAIGARSRRAATTSRSATPST